MLCTAESSLTRHPKFPLYLPLLFISLPSQVSVWFRLPREGFWGSPLRGLAGARLMKPGGDTESLGFSGWRLWTLQWILLPVLLPEMDRCFLIQSPSLGRNVSFSIFKTNWFIFGCPGSSLLCGGYSPGARGLQQMRPSSLAAPQHVGPFQIRAWTCVLCISLLLLRLVFTPLADCTQGAAVFVSSPVFSG